MEPRIHRACRVMGKPTKKPEKTVKGRTLEALEKSAVTHMADVSGKMSETVTWVTLTGNVSGILVRGEKKSGVWIARPEGEIRYLHEGKNYERDRSDQLIQQNNSGKSQNNYTE